MTVQDTILGAFLFYHGEKTDGCEEKLPGIFLVQIGTIRFYARSSERVEAYLGDEWVPVSDFYFWKKLAYSLGSSGLSDYLALQLRRIDSAR